jgi:hypothetical protein
MIVTNHRVGFSLIIYSKEEKQQVFNYRLQGSQ